MSRREEIRLDEREVREFLLEQRTVICATNGRDGWPHLMPLWYVVRDGPQLWAWTYARSQKVRNLERDARATLQVETGEQYHELRGVMLETEVVIHRDTAVVRELGMEIFARYAGDGTVASLPVEVTEMVSRQAAKRVGLQFCERRRSSWDHGKLAGAY